MKTMLHVKTPSIVLWALSAFGLNCTENNLNNTVGEYIIGMTGLCTSFPGQVSILLSARRCQFSKTKIKQATNPY